MTAPEVLTTALTSALADTGGVVSAYLFGSVAADGQRFLFQRYASNVTGDSATGPIAVVMKWTNALPDQAK